MAYPKISFPASFDDLVAFETEAKGWCTGVVELENGSLHTVAFYDPARLAQEVASSVAAGESYFAEYRLIVVPAINEAAMRASVLALHKSGWFSAKEAT